MRYVGKVTVDLRLTKEMKANSKAEFNGCVDGIKDKLTEIVPSLWGDKIDWDVKTSDVRAEATNEEIVLGLQCCAEDEGCAFCPYKEIPNCTTQLSRDALKLIKIEEK